MSIIVKKLEVSNISLNNAIKVERNMQQTEFHFAMKTGH